ncbi:helix-turn-helix domain-containing protein [Pedobacter sandarakinus]|uniref:helix-turn-helix domain-containing protein n=1 Tax=Pedobacter sandarakinus TaxID=353156 RepID=UPI0022465D9F|nr:helix-turn-helix transcriptional regulator [Pedobacter sandarakinus]MCX2575230.1 helix-turn-helix transcriptional regulator [Pedobacter sandarakinus]
MDNVGEHIKQRRIALGLSQAEAASLLQISTPALCKIETGQTDLNLSRLFQIAEAFRTNATLLINGNHKDAEGDGIIELKKQIAEKDEEINKLRKKVIDLYEKLGI